MQQPTVLGEPEAKADQGFCCRQYTGDQERITQSPQYQASSRVLAYNESPDARHLLCPIMSSPSFLSVGISPSGQRFRKKEITCCAVADILVVLILNAILFGAESFAEVGKKPDRLFIHANNGIVFVIWRLYTSSTSSIAATKAALCSGGIHQHFFRSGLNSFFKNC